MQTKKLTKFLALAVLATIGLTSCSDDIIAKPSDYDDKIVTFEEEVYNNVKNIVYDAIREESLASEVLESVLYEFSKSIVGSYNHLTTDNTDEITLKDATEAIHLNGQGFILNETTTKFIDDHKAYHVLDDNDEHDRQQEYAKVVAKWNSIEERIAEKCHEEIAGGAYSFRNRFDEREYLYSLYTALGNVANPTKVAATSVSTDKLISPDIEPEEVFDKELLHRENYQFNYELGQDETASTNPYTYIEDDIIPGIYNELLVEQYLLDETYNTLGRSYARNVNIVSIKSNEKYPKAATYLVNHFVDTVINNKANTKPVTLDTFKTLSNAWKGVDLTTDEENLLKGSKGFTAKGGYYLGTEYADVMEDYNKITDNPATTDTAIEASFTGNNSYPKEVGLSIKKDEIDLKDHTENGWYIKNGGLSHLPEGIRSRLFNIAVANALDNDETIDRWSNEFDADEESAYVAKINGAYYLKVSETQGGSSTRDILHYDADSKTYYIVQIVEATSTSKLSRESENAYGENMEEIVNEVVRVVADNETYKTLSTEHWLKEADLEYHDTVVYDYFKENYPDLFD